MKTPHTVTSHKQKTSDLGTAMRNNEKLDALEVHTISESTPPTAQFVQNQAKAHVNDSPTAHLASS